MTIACIDTQILSFGLVRIPPKGNEHLVSRASDFLKWIEEQKYTVILPTIVVGELLTAIPSDRHTEILKLLKRDWRIVEFDLAAAQQFAVMRRDHILRNRLHSMIDPDRPGATREALKADVMIISTAIANHADIIYSHNQDLINLAEGFIAAKHFENEQFQMRLEWPEDEQDK